MTYQEATEYLFTAAPLFQNVGKGAYKEGLATTLALDERFHHPHRHYKTIHIAGTNGKGSCSHTLAAILQCAGYKVGLYTSPHLLDFRERIRVNGEMIPGQRVVDFVQSERDFFSPLRPSFFELTTALAFLYFKERNVDVAVVEVGMGGRLDCTNIIQPELSVITNISFDHTQFLGHTLSKIASEKAGIIKEGVSVVVGETDNHADVREVFLRAAEARHAPITFADEAGEILGCARNGQGCVYNTRLMGNLTAGLSGLCQDKNTATILRSIRELRRKGFRIPNAAIAEGFASVCPLTGLMGRWQQVGNAPLTICDTAHNPAGLSYIGRQLRTISCAHTYIIIGMVDDKDVGESLSHLPKDATYLFTQASVKRAMKAWDIALIGGGMGLRGKCFPTVGLAYEEAKSMAGKDDLIFVGGSSFVVADFLQSM